MRLVVRETTAVAPSGAAAVGVRAAAPEADAPSSIPGPVASPLMRYVARPFVCGVLGRPDPERLRRLHAAVPGLVTVHERPDLLLLASRPLVPYRSEGALAGGSVAWAFGDRQPAAGVGWQAAAVAVEAAGLADDDTRTVLHAGAHGFLDVFHRQLADGRWFASRIEPLLALEPGALAIDWDAWACTIVLTIPVADRTPFVGIRRLLGARTLVLDHETGSLTDGRWDPPWVGLPAPAGGASDVGAVLEALRGAVAGYGDAPTTLPLTGGYDSRLLGILLRDAGTPVAAITTTKDDGRDDVGIAREVAARLGFPHSVVDPAGLSYGDDATEVLARMEHRAAQHTWAGALARRVRSDGLRVADGIAFDTLLHNEHIPPAAVVAPPGPERDAALFDALWRGGLSKKVLTVEATEWLADSARRQWQARSSELADDPNGLVLSVLGTRTTMGVGIMAEWLYGPEAGAVMPAFDADVVAAALAVDPARKIDGAFYRDLLIAADPAIAAIRSTRDPEEQAVPGVRLKSSAEARGWLLDRTRAAGAVPGLVHPRLIELLETGRVRDVRNPDGSRLTPEHELKRRATISQSALGVGALGAWLEQHADRLDDLTPPWPSPQRTGPWSFARRLGRRAGTLVDRSGR